MKITIQFIGGFRDGTFLVGDTDVPRSAAAYPFLTDAGTIGKRVSELPASCWQAINEYPRPIDFYERVSTFRKAIYEIVSREIIEDCIIATAKYMGEESEYAFPKFPTDFDAV